MRIVKLLISHINKRLIDHQNPYKNINVEDCDTDIDVKMGNGNDCINVEILNSRNQVT